MLTSDDIKIFHKGGWTDFEIGTINEDLRLRPQIINPRNDAWQAVFKERLNYIQTKLNQGYSLSQISAKLVAYLMGKKEHSPFDYIREAYPIRGEKKTDFNARVAARAKIVDHFGRY